MSTKGLNVARWLSNGLDDHPALSDSTFLLISLALFIQSPSSIMIDKRDQWLRNIGDREVACPKRVSGNFVDQRGYPQAATYSLCLALTIFVHPRPRTIVNMPSTRLDVDVDEAGFRASFPMTTGGDVFDPDGLHLGTPTTPLITHAEAYSLLSAAT